MTTYRDIDLETTDLEWFALDMNGNLLHFSTAGQGPILEKWRVSREENECLMDLVEELATRCGFRRGTEVERVLDWADTEEKRDRFFAASEDFARRGFHSYDYQRSLHAYVLVAAPEDPLGVGSLAGKARELIGDALIEVDVATTEIIRPEMCRADWYDWTGIHS